MIPLRDRNPSGTVPIVTIGIIVVNIAVFLYQHYFTYDEVSFVLRWGFIPKRVLHFFSDPNLALGNTFLPLFTCMFMHGSWMHLIGNMWYLWIFGDNIEDRLGHFRYLFFYIICGIGASLTHTVLNITSPIPMVGASGAISGVLGAYFYCFPTARVLTLVPIFFFITLMELPAFLLLVIWFIFQFLSGAASALAPVGYPGGVAWWAHVGGFILGVILIRKMPKRPTARQRYYVVRFDRY